jgi:hypothetical protein
MNFPYGLAMIVPISSTTITLRIKTGISKGRWHKPLFDYKQKK